MNLSVNQIDYNNIIKFYNSFLVLEKKPQEIIILLESRGIYLMHGDNDKGYGFTVPSKKGEKSFLSSNYKSFVFKTNFNGLNIDKDTIYYNANPFQNQFNDWLRQNGNIEDKINCLTKREEELSKNAYTDWFNKNELENVKEELRQLKIKCIDGGIIKDKADFLNGISSENKNIIKEYFQVIDDIVLYADILNKLGHLINDSMKNYMSNMANINLDLSLITDSIILQKIDEYKSIMIGILSKYDLYENKKIKNDKKSYL